MNRRLSSNNSLAGSRLLEEQIIRLRVERVRGRKHIEISRADLLAPANGCAILRRKAQASAECNEAVN
jgi:hypothetical protein